MGGVSDALFGSKAKDAKVKDATPKEFAGLRAPTADAIAGIIASGGLPQFAGQTTAPISGTESQILQNLGTGQPSSAYNTAISTLQNQAAGQINPFAAPSGAQMFGAGQVAAQGFGPQFGQQALTDIAGGSYLNAASNPYLASVIQAATRPIIDQFGEQNLAQRSAFTGAGQQVQGATGSSPFQMADAKLNVGLANALGDVGTNIAFQNFQNEGQRQLQALGLGQQGQQNAFGRALGAQDVFTQLQGQQSAGYENSQNRALQAAAQVPAIERSQLENTLATLQAQALPRLIEQQGLDKGLAMYQQQQQSLLQALGLGGQLGSPTAVSLPGTNASGGLLGAIAGGAGGPIGTALGALL